MNEIEKLLSENLHRSVEENLGRDPVAVALDRRIADAALVASQVKYLGRAHSKLPSYYAARCVIPPLAFEQSSGEEAAARKDYGGGALCIDLTCGLGVDSLFLSRKFDRVVSVERNPELAAIARENFRRLGAGNIEVIDSSAEEFLARFDGRADLIYADPDRRNAAGKKMVCIGDCSPDVLSLMPRVRQVSPRLVVKLSPLFDVDEVFRVFGNGVRVEVVSAGGECKEVVAEVSESISAPTVAAVAIGLGEAEYPFEEWESGPQNFAPERCRWLTVPDVSLRKSRLARRYFAGRIDYIESDTGFGFSAANPGDIIGRAFAIESVEPFDPKDLKRRLKSEGVKSIDIMKRDFPMPADDIARQLGVKQGGSQTIAFTRAGGKLWQIYLVKR